MSAAETRLPSTTGWALVLAAAIGALVLSAVSPLVAVGAGCGVALAAALSGFDGSPGRVAVASALLAILAPVAVAAVGAAGSALAGALAATGIVLGAAARLVLVERLSATAIGRAGTAALFAGLSATGVSLLSFGVANADGAVRAIAGAVWFTGGVPGFLLAVGLAALAAAAALAVLPPAAFATPSGYGAYARSRRLLLSWLVLVVVVATLAVGALAIGARFVPALDSLAGAVVDGAPLRVASAIATVVGAAVAAVALSVRRSWATTRARGNAIVPIAVGAVCGALVPAPVAIAAAGDRVELVASLFGATAAALVVVGLLTVVGAAKLGSAVGSASAAIAAALAIGGVAAGASVDGGVGLKTTRIAVASLVAIAAALFAFDVGRYGRTLAREVGADGAAPEPQYARIGWSVLIAAVGVPVAGLGLAAATLLAPTLSVPATAAVLAGIGATVVAARLLFR